MRAPAEHMKSLITLIGCGKMGSAMLHGWLADSDLMNSSLLNRCTSIRHGLAAHANIRLYTTVAEAAAGRAATMIVLAVKPQMMDEAIADLGALAGADSAYLSIAAGLSTGWFRSRLGRQRWCCVLCRIRRRPSGRCDSALWWRRTAGGDSAR